MLLEEIPRQNHSAWGWHCHPEILFLLVSSLVTCPINFLCISCENPSQYIFFSYNLRIFFSLIGGFSTVFCSVALMRVLNKWLNVFACLLHKSSYNFVCQCILLENCTHCNYWCICLARLFTYKDCSNKKKMRFSFNKLVKKRKFVSFVFKKSKKKTIYKLHKDKRKLKTGNRDNFSMQAT